MGKHNAPRKVSKEINHAVLRQAMLRRLPRVVAGSGKLFFPAVPALTEHFTEVLHKMFAVLGRVFDKEETKGIRESLRTKLDEAFNRSADSRVMVEYHTNEPHAIGRCPDSRSAIRTLDPNPYSAALRQSA